MENICELTLIEFDLTLMYLNVFFSGKDCSFWDELRRIIVVISLASEQRMFERIWKLT